jgi:hypothetical protein
VSMDEFLDPGADGATNGSGMYAEARLSGMVIERGTGACLRLDRDPSESMRANISCLNVEPLDNFGKE